MYARERFSERISGFRFHVVPMSRRMLFLPPTVFFQLNKLSLYFVIQKENSVPEWLIKGAYRTFVLGLPFRKYREC